MDTGGFHEFIKTNNTDILTELFHDILNRDIIVRHGIRDARSLKNLAVYLVSNAGNLMTASKLQQPLKIKAAATVLDYFNKIISNNNNKKNVEYEQFEMDSNWVMFVSCDSNRICPELKLQAGVGASR